MCLLALFFRAVDDAPVVIGANREEFYARGGEAPALVPTLVPNAPRVVAGLDPQAGGTWLGINEHGVAVAVTNRRKSTSPTKPRSRGLLVRECLTEVSAQAAAARAQQALDGGPYAGCNLLCVDAERAILVQAGDWLRVRPLPTGLHVLGNGDVNDEGERRVGHAVYTLTRTKYQTANECLAGLQALCSSTEPPEAPICWHGPERGTVSSTLVALRRPLVRSTMLHAQGAPDQVAYKDCSQLLRELAPMGPEGLVARNGR